MSTVALKDIPTVCFSKNSENQTKIINSNALNTFFVLSYRQTYRQTGRQTDRWKTLDSSKEREKVTEFAKTFFRVKSYLSR